MGSRLKYLSANLMMLFCSCYVNAQKQLPVSLLQSGKNTIDVFIGGKPFTSFLFPDSLEKPVLYPVYAANGTIVTRGFPLKPEPGDPIDHPHHIGIWFNYENVNGLDFWNNSKAIPASKKAQYGWIRTDKILQTSNGTTGILRYHANWTNQQNKILAREITQLSFSGNDHQRVIDRVTTITADTVLLFADVKDGLLGLRLAHALQIPTGKDQKFTDDKGNVTIIKGGADKVANGNYTSSEGKAGDSVWGTRARWCKAFGKMSNDSISVVIIDHPLNPNYPTFWHARGYGLFAANPLGEKVFTNGASSKSLRLKKGESVIFRYRIVIDEGKQTISHAEIETLADDFKKLK